MNSMISKWLPMLGGAMLLAGGFSSCSSDDLGYDAGERQVKLSVNITRESDATRSVLSEENGDLNCVWGSTDKVLVTDSEGNKLGVLDIVEGAGQPTATFDGFLTLAGIPDGTANFNFIYLGEEYGDPLYAPNPTVFDFSIQDGTLDQLSKRDFFTSTQSVEIKGATAYTPDMGLSRKTAFGHFELIFPQGVEYAGQKVKISGAGINNTANITMTNGVTFSAGTITVTGGKDFYVTLLPTEGVQLAPEFRVTINNKVYKGSLNPRTVAPSAFLRLSQGVGVPVNMLLTDEDPGAPDPGDFDNWGGTVDYPSAPFGSVNKTGSSNQAWAHNWYTDVDRDFGYAAPVQYDYNGMINGILTSASYRDGGQAKYFQWGRWLGFPMNVVYATVQYYGGFAMKESRIRYPRSIDAISTNDQRRIYYCWDMDSRPCYAWMTDTGWDKQQAINSSIIFGVNEYDYLNDQSICKWEDRSGNPCPPDYRIPTMEEMEVFAPTVEEFTTSYAEVKTIRGTKYAMRWTVVDATHVKVESVPTTKNSVTTSDAIFANAKSVTFEANGMLYCNFPESIFDSPSALFATSFDGGWKTSGYWTNESAAWADGKVGGVALMVRIKGNSVKMNMEIVERTAGLCVMPIKQEGMMPKAIKPWFPLGY